MKADSHYKMSKSVKRMLATLPKNRKNDTKDLMIQAELDYKHNKKVASKSKQKDEE